MFLEEIEFYGLFSNYYFIYCDDLLSIYEDVEEILLFSLYKCKFWLWFEFL